MRASGGPLASAASGPCDGRAPVRRVVDPHLEEALLPPVPVGGQAAGLRLRRRGGLVNNDNTVFSALKTLCLPWVAEKHGPGCVLGSTRRGEHRPGVTVRQERVAVRS